MTRAILNNQNPEPVPAASQLLGQAFLSGVDGFLRQRVKSEPSLRTTLHRVMTRDGFSYLQQLCGYVSAQPPSQATAGRMNPVTHGIIGSAYSAKTCVRTRRYNDEATFRSDLVLDMADTGDTSEPDAVAVSYLAIPMLGVSGETAVILYADIKVFNLFASDDIIEPIVQMCAGFCRVVDSLISSPVGGFRNFPLEEGRPVMASRTVYPRLQEVVDLPEVPRFALLNSFNFETRI